MTCKKCIYYFDLRGKTGRNEELYDYDEDDKICLNNNNTTDSGTRLEFIIIDTEHIKFVKKHGCCSYKEK